MDAKPTARSENLIIEELDRGMVVYDSLTQEAHALDPMATSVWRAADGQKTTRQLAEATGLEQAAVVATLDQLRERGLFTDGASVSRRSMLRRSATFGAAAIAAAPLIETIVIPTAAAHASTIAPPPQPVYFGTITPDNFSAVVTIPAGLALPGRHLIRQGNTQAFAPTTLALFSVKDGSSTITFTNNFPTGGSGAPYHYVLLGTDGLGHTVNITLPGTQGSNIQIPFGSKLNVGINWIPS
jgi:hypothetical protein